LGIDISIVVRFNKAFARLPAERFVKKILLEKIGAFGRGAKGDYELLGELAGQYQFKLKVFPVVRINNRPVSSTYIRRLIIQGNLAAARRLLGRPVSVLGTVIRGDSFGRRLGFPTANINPHHEVLPPSGVYAVRITLTRRQLKGVCYIGSNFIKKIRKEKKLKSSLSLIRQIKKDILQARAYLSLHK
jgi:riboflavin kinase/FMN adenylyltransferase